MGASHSSPETVHLKNPYNVVPIEITSSVITRLKENGQSKKQKADDENLSNIECKEQIFNDKHRDIKSDNGLEEKYCELEKRQFEKSVENVTNLLDSRIFVWNKEFNNQIIELRTKLIECYTENPGESLCCAKLAQAYRQLIFEEQYKTLLKFLEPATPADDDNPDNTDKADNKDNSDNNLD